MPGFDGTGPLGIGPTGGRRGIRGGYFGRGRALAYGLGCAAGAGLGLLRQRRLRGRFLDETVDDSTVKDALLDEKKILEQRLKEINDRVNES